MEEGKKGREGNWGKGEEMIELTFVVINSRNWNSFHQISVHNLYYYL